MSLDRLDAIDAALLEIYPNLPPLSNGAKDSIRSGRDTKIDWAGPVVDDLIRSIQTAPNWRLLLAG